MAHVFGNAENLIGSFRFFPRWVAAEHLTDCRDHRLHASYCTSAARGALLQTNLVRQQQSCTSHSVMLAGYLMPEEMQGEEEEDEDEEMDEEYTPEMAQELMKRGLILSKYKQPASQLAVLGTFALLQHL